MITIRTITFDSKKIKRSVHKVRLRALQTASFPLCNMNWLIL